MAVKLETWERYAEGIRSGRTMSPRYVKAALTRHDNDLKRKRFPYVFEPERGLRVIRFLELLRLGSGLTKGEAVHLEPWQHFLIVLIFGWVRKDSGERRFNNVFISLPKKNGKTALISWLMLYFLIGEKTMNFSGICTAFSEKQAALIHREIKAVLRCTPGLKKYLIPRDRYFVCPPLNGRFTVRATNEDALDGLNENLLIIDEFHTQDSDSLYNIIKNGLGSQYNQMLVIITTAGKNPHGFARRHEEDLKRIIDGQVENDRIFGILWQPEPGDNFDDPKVWKAMNPNFGVSFDESAFRSLYQEAKAKGGPAWNNFQTFRLNFWTRNYEAWLTPAKIEPHFKPLKESDYHGRRAWLALDLSKNADLSGYTITVEEDSRLVTFFRAWVPESTMARRAEREAIDVDLWARAGRLRVCPGDYIDQDVIFAQMEQDAKDFDVVDMSFDRAMNAIPLVLRAEKVLGWAGIAVPQTSFHLSPQTRGFEEKLAKGELLFDKNPVAVWCFLNARLLLSKYNTNQLKVVKPEDQSQHIDLLVCAIMSVWAASLSNQLPEEEVGGITI